jgi:outer membrane protein assembly factor BamB
MHRAGKLVSVGIFAFLAGCSSLNPFSGKPAPKNPPAALVDFKPSLGIHSAWTMSIGRAGDFTFSPALASDSVFVAAADGSIARLDASSGHIQWRINAGVPLTAGVGSDGNTVVVAGEKGTLLAFDGAGKLRWKAQTSSEILSAPAVGQGLVIVRSLDNRIAAFDADSGSRRWTVQRTTPALTLRSAPGIVIANSNAIVGLPGGRLLALALTNGGVRWEIAVSDPRGATEIERIADISGSPVVLGRDVCAVAYQGRIGCYDLNSGAPRWVKDLSSEVGLSIDERFVFAADERGALTAFSRTSGQSIWRNDKLANRRLSAPVSFGRAVAVGDSQGYIHFLSREDGSFIGRVSTDGSPTLAAPVVAGANLILQTQSGTVVALATE